MIYYVNYLIFLSECIVNLVKDFYLIMFVGKLLSGLRGRFGRRLRSRR